MIFKGIKLSIESLRLVLSNSIKRASKILFSELLYLDYSNEEANLTELTELPTVTLELLRDDFNEGKLGYSLVSSVLENSDSGAKNWLLRRILASKEGRKN